MSSSIEAPAKRGPGGKFLPKSKAQEVAEIDNAKVFAAVKDVSVEKVVDQIGKTQLLVQKSLADVGSELTNRINQLRDVEQAIALSEARLKELHQIEAQVITLDELRSKEEELVEQHKIDAQKRLEAWRSEDVDRNQRWKREYDEHNYEQQVSEKKALDTFTAEMDQKHRYEAVRVEQLNRGWAEREAALKAKEQEFAALQAQVAAFPARMDAEVKKAEAIVGNSVKRDYEHRIALMDKDTSAALSLSKATHESLQKTNSELIGQISNLQGQLTAARQDALNITQKALESASGRQVTEALQNVVQQQGQSGTGKSGSR